VAASSFTMGSAAAEPCRLANEDQHTVTLTRAFEIQTTEVTQAQFEELMGYNNAVFYGKSRPAEAVSWHEAAGYCNRLSDRAGLSPCYACSGSPVRCDAASGYQGAKIYSCPGYRLPSEAEWELAYRAGTTSALYSGALDPAACSACAHTDANAARIGWYCGNSQGTTRTVGTREPNALGLHDMAGNVWEWCHDPYLDRLGPGAATDPLPAPSGGERVMKGGGYSASAEHLRAARREGADPDDSYLNVGFRCARTRE